MICTTDQTSLKDENIIINSILFYILIDLSIL